MADKSMIIPGFLVEQLDTAAGKITVLTCATCRAQLACAAELRTTPRQVAFFLRWCLLDHAHAGKPAGAKRGR